MRFRAAVTRKAGRNLLLRKPDFSHFMTALRSPSQEFIAQYIGIAALARVGADGKYFSSESSSFAFCYDCTPKYHANQFEFLHFRIRKTDTKNTVPQSGTASCFIAQIVLSEYPQTLQRDSPSYPFSRKRSSFCV